MSEITEGKVKTHWFKDHQDYWKGIAIIILLYSIAYASTDTSGLGLVAGILISLILSSILFSLISGVIFLITWPFKKNFELKRFLKILTVVSLLSLISKVIVLIMYS